MPSLTFRILNVFTQDGGTFTGNPLCVFENGAQLDGSTMQKLARQFNLSETTFILPSSRADARVRIFTPDYEMPFAGHPTLGTAAVCRALGLGGDSLTLEMQAGLIPVHAAGAHWTLQANPATWRPVDTPVATLAKMLGLTVTDIGAQPLWVKAGKEQLIIPLCTADAVRRVRVDSETFGTVRSEDGVCMAYVFAETAPGHVLARFFFTNGGIAEDPATGSATANLGGWLLAQNRALPLSYEISQGEYTHRPSTLRLTVTGERHILVSGEVIEIGRGTLQS